MSRKAIGIDLGGTDIKAGVVDDTGKLLSKVSTPTQATADRETVIGNIARAADMAREAAGLAWRSIAAVGLGSPGSFEPPLGLVHHTENIKCLEGHELARPVERAIGRKGVEVTLDNDANVATFAEFWIGRGRGKKNLALMTLGTGIGGGLILDGKLWRGAWGTAGELGHQILFIDQPNKGCGTPGGIEDYASATGLVRRFHEAVAAGKRTRLSRKAKKGEPVTARDIGQAAREGDRLCLKLVEETGRYLGVACTNLFHILNVEMIVFAGGMSAMGDLLLDTIRKEAEYRTFPLAWRGVEICFSELGNDAGLIGAAGTALQANQQKRARGRATR